MKMKNRALVLAAGLCAAFCSLAETNGVAAAASEVRTFRLQYASAAEVAEQINALMSREAGPDGKLLPVAVANAEANTVTVMAAPDKVAACGRIISDVDLKPKQVYVEARFVALSTSAARTLGLKWNMLQKGVGIEHASASGGLTYQHVPEGIKTYSERIRGGRNGGFESDTTYDLENQSKMRGLWADSSYFQGTVSSTDLSLLLQAFDDDSDIKTFANPKIIVSSGKEATVDMTRKRPSVELSAKRVVGDKNNTLDIDSRRTPRTASPISVRFLGSASGSLARRRRARSGRTSSCS